MTEKKDTGLLNLLVIFVKWKRFFILLFIISMVLSYLAIYFFVTPRFDASSLLLPSGEQANGGILSGLSGLSGLKGLPLGLGNFGENSDVDIYNSIVYSRTLLNSVIKKFDLIKVYKIDTTTLGYYELMLKQLRNSISADINDDGVTYSITVSAPTPQLAAEMTNFIVKQLNDKIVTLKIKKAKDNREFLEKRVNDVKDSLNYAEDQLEKFQKRTGMFEAESQTKAILEQLAKFQAQIAEKQTEYSIYKQLYGNNSAQAHSAKIVAEEFAAKLKQIEVGKDSINTLLALNNLPKNVINYFRLYGNVQIYTNILEFELPLYEQAKFQEQKDVPVLQVIDPAIPPAKRSYPKRTIMAFIITVVLMLISLVFILLRENKNLNESNGYIYIKNNLFKWKSGKYNS